MNNSSHPHPNAKPQSVSRSTPVRLALSLVAALMLAVVIGTVVLAVGIYGGHWRSRFVESVTRVVPIPVVSVNGHWRPYHQFLEAYATLDYALSQPELLTASGFATKPTPTQLEGIVIDRLAKDEIVRQLATRRGIVVSDADVAEQMRKVVEQTGSAADVEVQIRKLYRWDLATYQRQVIEPFLIRLRLQESIAADASLNAAQQARAEQLLSRVKAGEDFQPIAREVNEDVTKDTGGDLGVFARGERDAALEEAAFALEMGQTSGIVRTKDGFHILKVLEKLPADSQTGDGERVHVAHIFLSAKPLDAWLFEQGQLQRVSIFYSGYRWDRSQTRVVPTDDVTASTKTTP